MSFMNCYELFHIQQRKYILNIQQRAWLILFYQIFDNFAFMLHSNIGRRLFSNIKILISNSNNIHFNLATEQYLFQTAKLPFPTLFLWQNSPTIVIGRHQNPWKQCKIQQMNANNVLLSRRKTGGGAVYHDLGNTCFSFLTPYTQSQEYDYKTVNNSILINTFKKLGIPAEVAGRNDLHCQGKKISGSAYRLHLGNSQGVKKALHHGTVMFNVDLQALQRYLNPNKKKLESKGVDSVISRVMNLNQKWPHLNHSVFCKELESQFQKHYGGQIDREVLTAQNLDQSNQVIKNNYQRLVSWEWLYGQCPQFKYQIDNKFDWGMTQVTFNVAEGFIKQAKVYSDCLYPDFIDLVNTQIVKTIKYDTQGINQLETNLKAKLDINFHQMASDLCDWMRKSL